MSRLLLLFNLDERLEPGGAEEMLFEDGDFMRFEDGDDMIFEGEAL